MLYKNKFFLCRIRKHLIIGFSKRAGRNFFGRKTILTQSGGIFNKNYILDFKRNMQYNSILLIIHKDYNRTGFIGLVCYENGLNSYILLSSDHIEIGIGKIIYGFINKLKKNSSTFLLNIPNGNFIHHIEIKPNIGATISRAAGCSSFIISRDNLYIYLKMNSG
jgi:ribosomal protein L2